MKLNFKPKLEALVMHRKKIILSVLILACAFFFSSCREMDVEALQKVLKDHQMIGAKYVGSETCAMCHEKKAKSFKLAAHERVTIPMEGIKVEGCEMCHGPGSLHSESGKGKIINPKKDPRVCFACHMEKKTEFSLPYHHPVLEGYMSCTDCHDVHGPVSRPWSATSMNDVNEKCFKCHKDKRGPFIYEHLALREGCTSCHKVHGSINDKMLTSRDASLCLRCHGQANFPTVGSSHTSSRLAQGVCYSSGCHTSIHGSNFDRHLKQ